MANPLRKCNGERGQAAVFASMTLTLSLGLVGMVVNIGWGYWRQEACETAAQSAAVAGVMFAMSKNSTWPPSSCTTSTAVVCQATATPCSSTLTLGTTPTTDVQAACLYAQQNGFQATGNQNVTIAANTGNPPTVSGATTAYYITARVSEMVPQNFLAALTGNTTNMVSARATAGVISTAAASCVYILDPTDNSTLALSNGVSVQSECGFWINSSGATALSVTGGATLKALDSTSIDLVGGYTNSNGGNISPTPKTSAAAADPFLSRNVPLQRSVTGSHTYSCNYPTGEGCAHTSTSTYACDFNNFSQTSWVASLTMTPGVYCGGITIGNVNSVTFNPGVYILDGGGMCLGCGGGISGGASGAGVSFFNTGTTATYKYISIGNGVNVTFSAPTAGSMQGLLFYQDPSLTVSGLSTNANTTSMIEGGSVMNLSGSLYFPTTAVTFGNGTSSGTGSVGLVAYQASFNGGAYFKSDTTGITSLGGSPKSGIVE